LKENALSCDGLRDLRLTFLPAWLRNFVAACGLAHSPAAYGGLRRRLWGLPVSIGPKYWRDRALWAWQSRRNEHPHSPT